MQPESQISGLGPEVICLICPVLFNLVLLPCLPWFHLNYDFSPLCVNCHGLFSLPLLCVSYEKQQKCYPFLSETRAHKTKGLNNKQEKKKTQTHASCFFLPAGLFHTLTFCISSLVFCQHQEETKLKNSWSSSLCEDYSDCLYINSSCKRILKELWDFIKEKRASWSCPPARLIPNIQSSLICAIYFQSSIWSQSGFWIKLWKIEVKGKRLLWYLGYKI